MTPLTDIIDRTYHISAILPNGEGTSECLVNTRGKLIWSENIRTVKFTELIKPSGETAGVTSPFKYKMLITTNKGEEHQAVYSHNDVCHMFEAGAFHEGDRPDDVGTKGHSRHNYGKSAFRYL